MIAILMVASLSANAQEVGAFIKPMAGATLTTLTGDLNDLKMKVGFTGGVTPCRAQGSQTMKQSI